MAINLRWFLYFFILFSSCIYAQEKAPLMPDPLSLEANWWTYFESTESTESIEKSELDSRIEKVDVHLKTLLKDLNNNQSIDLEPLVKGFYKNLLEFSAFKQSKPAPLLALNPTAKTYTPDQATERFVLWRKLKHSP